MSHNQSDYEPQSPKRGELFRDPSRGKIFGVCAGVADYFGLEVWVVRIITVTALLFFQFPIFIAYMVGYFVLEPKPGTGKYDKFTKFRKGSRRRGHQSSRDSEEAHGATVKQIWRKGRIPGQTLKHLNKQFQGLESRLRSMESYVTSKQFELRKDFEELSS